MHFKGRIVIESVLSDLVDQKGLGSGPFKDTLIFGGGSAGGRGAMMHLDYVSEMLGPQASPNVDVVGFLDSPLWIDYPPFNPDFEGFVVRTKGVFENMNVTHTD